MKKILLPADFSGPGQASLNFAADLAQRTGAELIVQDFSAAGRPETSAAPPATDPSATELPELTYWRSIHPDLTVRVEPAETPLDEAVPDACRQHQPDLVILGAISHRVNEGVLSQSLSRTARRSEYPVLVVERPVELPLQRILFVSDFSEPEMAVFERILSLVGLYNPEIHLLYVKNSQYFDMPIILAESVMRDFEDRASSFRTHSHVIQQNSISGAVGKFVKELDIDLVALGNQPRSLFYRLFTEDVLSGILHDTDTPVLIVPRFEAEEKTEE